jgi:predicted AAA+ superfamily ATPase
MLNRIASTELLTRLATYPAAALVGPRQCGKTTLALALGGEYFDLELRSDRLRFDLDWAAVTEGDRLVILDEAQEWPELFPRLRSAIDADRQRNGRFLILGSVSPALTSHVSESLAGRLSLLELTPLLLNEVGTDRLDEHWLRGGYPDGGILSADRYPRWQLDYLTLLAQRDLPNWGLTASAQTTERLVRIIAALHGQNWNASQVGASLGVSYHTINGYLDYLVGAFLLRRLHPWTSNVGKRLVKSPRVYWRDSGLLHALLSVSDRSALLVQPGVGASWEGYVIEQTLSTLTARGVPHDAWYFRTSDGHECDLVLEVSGERWAIEIKLTTSPAPEDIARLDKTADMIGATHRFLVSQTTTPTDGDRRASCTVETLLARLPS